ncbi:polysaccharide biosynthesis protein [Qipengyuania marisflavi]|uniref:Polysaccharide biosynthesis protein n=1 Tax=Qipengyuania marisflavi TaxID=2486356 RepID=A0A5S3PAF0_9SPHN|nr:polysaccharide biosynthesis protein [Qipengyuania marisflavi]
MHEGGQEQAVLMDKVTSKALVQGRLGRDWVIPTAWHGDRLPEQQPFACPAIMKARHGCNQNVVLRHQPDSREWQALRALGEKWTAKPYGTWLDESAYRDTTRGLIAEPLLGDSITLPLDYKIYVFGGRATHVQVHLGRAGRHRWILHDRDWRQLVPGNDRPTAPESLSAMLDAAEQLAAGHSFLRVDFYEIDRQPLFGEFCLYPGSGLDPFAADWIDFELGDLWRAALGGRPVEVAGAIPPQIAAA